VSAIGPVAVDPVTLAILKGRLEQIADEMDATLYRSAFNPIIAEARDACHGLYHAQTGATLVQGALGLPIFVGAMAFAVKAVIDKVARDGGLAPGDTYIFNDPYDGGTHLNDFRLVRPIYRDGRVFCWLASVGHWLDVGGNVAGGYNPKATESYQEGMRLPPVKLISAGRLNQDIVDVMAANSRSWTSNWGDLNGQLNALDLGERRLMSLLDEYGDATVSAAFDAFADRAEAMMRAAAHGRARSRGARRCDDARLLALVAAGIGTGEHCLLDRGGRLLRRNEARLHRRSGQCRLPAPDHFRHSRDHVSRRQGAEAGRRLHRDHPAPDRRDLRCPCQSRREIRDRGAIRDHQCAVADRTTARRLALGDVLVFRRRPRRQSGKRRPQPCQ
jgi:hypothetical protein